MEKNITNILPNKDSNIPTVLNINPEKCWINTKSTNIFKSQKAIKKQSKKIKCKNIYKIVKLNIENCPQTKQLKSMWFEWILI